MKMCCSSRKGKNDLQGSSEVGGSVIDIKTLRSTAQGIGQLLPEFQNTQPHHEFQRVGLFPRAEEAGPPPKVASPVGPGDQALNQRGFISSLKI